MHGTPAYVLLLESLHGTPAYVLLLESLHGTPAYVLLLESLHGTPAYVLLLESLHGTPAYVLLLESLHGTPAYVLLLESLHGTPAYVLLFDESYNPVTKDKQMDVHVRYWSSDCDIAAHYITSVCMGHGRADDLLVHFLDATEELNMAKVVQVSMDGPKAAKEIEVRLQLPVVGCWVVRPPHCSWCVQAWIGGQQGGDRICHAVGVLNLQRDPCPPPGSHHPSNRQQCTTVYFFIRV